MVLFHGLSYNDISDILNTTVATSKPGPGAIMAAMFPTSSA